MVTLSIGLFRNVFPSSLTSACPAFSCTPFPQLPFAANGQQRSKNFRIKSLLGRLADQLYSQSINLYFIKIMLSQNLTCINYTYVEEEQVLVGLVAEAAHQPLRGS